MNSLSMHALIIIIDISNNIVSQTYNEPNSVLEWYSYFTKSSGPSNAVCRVVGEREADNNCKSKLFLIIGELRGPRSGHSFRSDWCLHSHYLTSSWFYYNNPYWPDIKVRPSPSSALSG